MLRARTEAFDGRCSVKLYFKTLWPLFMDGVQLKSTAISRRQFTFYHSVPRNSWYSFYRPRKDEGLSRPWSHPVVLDTGLLDWESSALATRPLLQKRCKKGALKNSAKFKGKRYEKRYSHTGVFLWILRNF